MIKFLLRLLNVLIPARWYIVHIEVNWGQDAEFHYFGPFRRRELPLRLSDDYAELLGYGHDIVKPVKLSWLEARDTYITPRSFWLEQVDEFYEDEPPIWRQDH